jgi:uncharacterized protein
MCAALLVCKIENKEAPMSKYQLVAAVLAALSGLHAQAASFDCTKASARVERMICADISLSRLDDAMDQTYGRMRAAQREDAGADGWLKKTQREWLRRRNACDMPQCVRDAYVSRIEEVCGMPVASGVHPGCPEVAQ